MTNYLKRILPQTAITTPVLFLIFNRLDTTRQVFEEIRKARPQHLFIASDGPRPTHPEEKEIVRAIREYVILSIDWDCEVHTLFRDENLGCKRAVSSAIDWFFSLVDEGIILEDDCLPDQSFFPFCQDLLSKYRYDTRIMMIGGTNFQFGRNKSENSYYFSRYFHIWGWASWKRAWQHYDVDMRSWPEIRENRLLHDIFHEKRIIKYWESIFDRVYNGNINTWDYQWVFSCWIQGGLSIIPNQNLISNIGYGQSGTHTTGNCIFSKMSHCIINFPLKHPKYVIRNTIADEYTEMMWYSQSNLLRKLIKIIKERLS